METQAAKATKTEADRVTEANARIKADAAKRRADKLAKKTAAKAPKAAKVMKQTAEDRMKVKKLREIEARKAEAAMRAAEKGKKLTKDQIEVVDLRKVPKAARPRPTSGQSGKPMDLPADKLTGDQKRILDKLNAGDTREVVAIRDLAIGSKEETGSGADKSILRVRNAMRNLVRGGWVENKGPGTDSKGKPARARFQITVAGRNRLAKA